LTEEKEYELRNNISSQFLFLGSTVIAHDIVGQPEDPVYPGIGSTVIAHDIVGQPEDPVYPGIEAVGRDIRGERLRDRHVCDKDFIGQTG